VAFANKVELAKRMLERAFETGVTAIGGWSPIPSSGRSHEFREWLEERGRAYAVMVPKTNAVDLGGRKKKIEQLAERLPEDAWSEVLSVEDSGERRPWQWACTGARRGSDDPDDLAFYQAYGPEDTSVEELVRVCQERWAIESSPLKRQKERSGWTITRC
jgi:hypothetical protein